MLQLLGRRLQGFGEALHPVVAVMRLDLGLANSNLSNVYTLLEIRNGGIQKLTRDLDACHNMETDESTRSNAKEGELGTCMADKNQDEGQLKKVMMSFKTLNTTAGYCCSVKTELNFTM